MAYRELITVAFGTEKQLEACIEALDLHEDAPQEHEDLINTLESAIQLCKTIQSKGEAEPEEEPQPVKPADNGVPAEPPAPEPAAPASDPMPNA